ncbi:hypothetical protein GJ496_007068 [Pomphorhynchus laevis]|nr:hypothetical protein GJ496_007068 [Pomphorhynchus laevis]
MTSHNNIATNEDRMQQKKREIKLDQQHSSNSVSPHISIPPHLLQNCYEHQMFGIGDTLPRLPFATGLLQSPMGGMHQKLQPETPTQTSNVQCNFEMYRNNWYPTASMKSSHPAMIGDPRTLRLTTSLSHQVAMTEMAPHYMYPFGFPVNGEFYGIRRKNATRETTSTLKAWLHEHRKNPYPTKNEKIILAYVTKMTLTQVSTWFANARRRLKKENKMTWVPKSKHSDDSDCCTDEDDSDCNNEDDEANVSINSDQESVKSINLKRTFDLSSNSTVESVSKRLKVNDIIDPNLIIRRKKSSQSNEIVESDCGSQRLKRSYRDCHTDTKEVCSKKPKIWSIAAEIDSNNAASEKVDSGNYEQNEGSTVTNVSTLPQFSNFIQDELFNPNILPLYYPFNHHSASLNIQHYMSYFPPSIPPFLPVNPHMQPSIISHQNLISHIYDQDVKTSMKLNESSEQLNSMGRENQCKEYNNDYLSNNFDTVSRSEIQTTYTEKNESDTNRDDAEAINVE